MTTTYAQAADVLIAAHLPDVKFEGRIISGSIDTMPISGLILELRRCLWGVDFCGTRKMYDQEYEQFIKIMGCPPIDCQQAVALGLPYGSGNKVKSIRQHIKDTLITDGVARMPVWLFNKCEMIWEDNLRGHVRLW